MGKNKFSTVYKIRLYPISYLMNEELSESDLNHLFDTKSLKYSIIISMFRFIGSSKRNCDIIKLCTTNKNWFDHYRWSQKQQKEFEDLLTKVFMNLYYYKEQRARIQAQWWLINYGLSVIGNKFDLSK